MGGRGASPLGCETAGTFRVVAMIDGSGGQGEGLRRTRGDAAGAESGSYFDERTAVNAGTTWLRFPTGRRPAVRVGIAAPTAERAGWGGAAVVLRAGRARHRGRAAAVFEKGRMLQCRK